MKIDTLIKLGSLAFNVAQDEKVRALVKMAHSGARRRGLYAPRPSHSPSAWQAADSGGRPYPSHGHRPFW